MYARGRRLTVRESVQEAREQVDLGRRLLEQSRALAEQTRDIIVRSHGRMRAGGPRH
jgi:hypothetical protein